MAAERLRQFASAAAAAAVSIARPNYFDTSKRGENYELRNELNSDLELVRKEAVKKVIASMTVGKDVSTLFPDVLKNIQTDDIELKKLVYLYLMNYAKCQPELVILAINTFCKDAEDPNPLVRALAIRTMGCLRVDKVLDYLCEPLRKALKDSNAYVRKTAAVCAAKVVELSPELAEENGFIDILKEMLSDSNATVIANAVAALSDIQMHNPETNAFRVDSRNASRLLAVLNECTEWGQISILDALANYTPASVEEAEQAIDKITPRFQHANASVVLSAVKIVLVYMEYLPEEHETRVTLKKKLAPPLVSMLSSPPEIQYVALRNINLILQRHRDILAQGVRVFFCKFNDPLYVKLEKLDVITLLIDEQNYEQVLSELSEYAQEVDVEFSNKAILAIASCANKVPAAAERAFAVLRQLVKSKVESVVQAVAIALHMTLRQYPNHADDILPALLDDMGVFDDDEARAAIAWIFGEYGHRLRNTVQIIGDFMDNFALEPAIVQSELLTASLKLFFHDTDTYRPILKGFAAKGAASCESADLRERCVMYGRLCDLDTALLRGLCSEDLGLQAPSIHMLDEATLTQLLPYLSTLAAIYHRLPEESTHMGLGSAAATRSAIEQAALPDLLSLDDEAALPQRSPSPHLSETAMPTPIPIVDLLAD